MKKLTDYQFNLMARLCRENPKDGGRWVSPFGHGTDPASRQEIRAFDSLTSRGYMSPPIGPGITQHRLMGSAYEAVDRGREPEILDRLEDVAAADAARKALELLAEKSRGPDRRWPAMAKPLTLTRPERALFKQVHGNGGGTLVLHGGRYCHLYLVSRMLDPTPVHYVLCVTEEGEPVACERRESLPKHEARVADLRRIVYAEEGMVEVG